MQASIDLSRVYYSNSVLDYLYVIGGIILTWLLLKIIKIWLLVWLKRYTEKSQTHFDDVLISAIEKFVIPYAYLVVNYTIINQLKLSAKASHAVDIAMTVVSIFFAIRVINHALHFSIKIYMRRRNEAEGRINQLNGVLNVIKAIIWVLGFLFLLDNLGYNVTTIITGLGIGGIAIALAAQNILSDLFSYFVIFFDKPFEVGDFIVAGSESGTVEQIGIKTSRVRTLGGEEMVMPNADLVKTTIHNFKRQEKRRVVFNIRVVYKTPIEQLKEIPGIIQSVIASKPTAIFDRAHLQSLADYFINYEIVYSIPTADFKLYMNLQQEILIELVDTFRHKGIDFAIPSETVLLKTPEEEERHTKA